MKTNATKKMLLTVLLTAVTMVSIGGCTSNENSDVTSDNVTKNQTEEKKTAEILYPVAINGEEILVGTTTVQTLLDQGFRVTVSEMTENYQINEYEIDPNAQLEANSYYTGGSIWITDSVYAHISMVTDENVIRMGDAVVASLEISLVDAEDADKAKIAFQGIPLNEMSRNKAGEVFSDFEGDENMWFKKGLEYDYYMSFSSEDSMLNELNIEKLYDVDWSNTDK